MEISATIAGIWRYPVKSMQGERLESAEVGAAGLSGDRVWALIEEETGKVVSAKSPRKWPDIFEYGAAYPEEPGGRVTITLPDGSCVRSEDEDAAARLSGSLGRGVRLSRTAPAGAKLEAYRPETEGTDDVRIAYAAPGTFFDFSAVHLLTTSTLAALSAAYPEGRFDVRRFRPNFLIDTGDEPGFVENEWVGRTVTIGSALQLQVVIPCPRCVMTTLPQGDLPADTQVLRVAARENTVEIPGFNARMPSVGVYATVLAPGPAGLGDTVSLVDET